MSTQIRGNKQIKNITIENDQLVNGTVELNKLKEGAELIKRDGSVPFTADVDAGSHKIVNVAPGTNSTDVFNKAQLDAVEAKVVSESDYVTAGEEWVVLKVEDGIFTLQNLSKLQTPDSTLFTLVEEATPVQDEHV